MKKKISGYITVYMALMIGVMLTLILLVLEGIRQHTIRYQTECVMDAGMNSIFAEYHREMRRQYGLLFIDDSYGSSNGGVSNTKSHLLSYMNMNFHAAQDMNVPLLKTKDITAINADNGELFKTSFASDNEGEVLRYQIVRYEKDITGVSVIDKEPIVQDIEGLLLDYDNYYQERITVNQNITDIEDNINSTRTENGEDMIHISNPVESVEGLSGISVLYYKIIFINVMFLMVCAYQDLRYRGISVWILAAGCIWSLSITVYRCINNYHSINAIIISVLPGVIMIITSILTKHIGLADGIIIIMLGLLMNPIDTYLLLLESSMFSLVYSIVLKLTRRKDSNFPFVPFLLIGYISVIMVV